MFLFMCEEIWRKHMDELGIQEVIDDLRAKGRPAEWPAKVVDPSENGTVYLPEGKPWYKSVCSCYEGYYLCGGTGSVQCRTAGELLPGIVWYQVCSKEYHKCPFHKESEENKC